jgi:neutral ceramidase
MNVAKKARAGWATADITPPLGLPMGGRGPQFAFGKEVLDPLEARVVVLEDRAGTRQLWISLDLVGVSTRTSFQMRQDVAMQTGIGMDAIVLNCVHTHAGPMANADKYAARIEKPPALVAYEDSLIGKVVRAAAEAVRNLGTVTAKVHRGGSRIGINRRNRGPDGGMDMRPNADGPCNEDLWVLDLEGDPGRAVVYSHGCHPVLVYGFAWHAISADWVGVSRRKLEAKLGVSAHCQFIQGMAGNVRPRIVSDFEANCFRKATPDDVEATGDELATDVVSALSTPGDVLELDLAAAAGSVLVAQDLDRVPSLESWMQLAESEQELDRNLGRFWSDRLHEGLAPSQGVYFDVGLLRLAEGHRIAWLAGEPVAEWLGILRRGLADERLTTWGYCQDVPCYLPCDCLLPEGGYEVERSRWYNKDGPSPFKTGIDRTILSELKKLAERL